MKTTGPWLALAIFIVGLAPAAARAQELPDAPRPAPHKAAWAALSVAGYAAATWDMRRTAHNLDRGDREQNPLARPFTALPRPAYYIAGEAEVTFTNYLGWRMQWSRHAWVRRIWWLPQTVQVAANVTCAMTSPTH